MPNTFTKESFDKELLAYHEEDIQNIKQLLKANNNIFIYSEPGYPSDVIINNITNAIKNKSFVFDLNKVLSTKHLLNYITESLLSQSSKLKEIFKLAEDYLPNIKPELTRKGKQTKIAMNYHITPAMTEKFLSEALDAFEKLAIKTKKEIYVFFHNYENIINISKELESVIKKKVTAHKNVKYIFSCTKEHVVSKIFSKKSSVSYKIKKAYVIQGPSITQAIKILNKHINITDENARLLLKSCGNLKNSYRVLSRIPDKKTSASIINKAQKDIITEMSNTYENIWTVLSAHQKVLLHTISIKGGSQIFSSQFIFENDLGSVPSVQTSINALMKKNILYKIKKEFYFNDIFFKDWITGYII